MGTEFTGSKDYKGCVLGKWFYSSDLSGVDKEILELIEKMKAEIKAIKQSGDLTTIPDGVSEKKKKIVAYMREHPEVTNKSLIAREVGVDKNTVRRYYDEIR